VAGSLSLAGCSADVAAQWQRFGLKEPASDRAPYMGDMWAGTWIAALVVGVFVWGLIAWVVIRYRRRPGDPEHPRQTKYNLPLELLYTLVPFLIVSVLFFYTVQTQNTVLAKEAKPQHVITVVAQKWSWTFSYLESANSDVGTDVHDVGTIDKIPDLYLPVNESVRFNLSSADVIHSFYVPGFYFKLDVIPGLANSFDLTPNKLGDFQGRCAELCGTYHAAMLFNVHVVSKADYVAHLNALKASGQVGEITAPQYPNTVPSAPAKEK
jgi:cytochrome c oxidase subunit 2